MTVREIDQQWIYSNYRCQASNAVNTVHFSVELRRAGMFIFAKDTESGVLK